MRYVNAVLLALASLLFTAPASNGQALYEPRYELGATSTIEFTDPTVDVSGVDFRAAVTGCEIEVYADGSAIRWCGTRHDMESGTFPPGSFPTAEEALP